MTRRSADRPLHHHASTSQLTALLPLSDTPMDGPLVAADRVVPIDFRRLSVTDDGKSVSGAVLVTASTAAVARNGRPYWRLDLADPHGIRHDARRFSCAEPPPAVNSVITITGKVETFAGRISLNLDSCKNEHGADPTSFRPQMPAARRATRTDLDALAATIADPELHRLVTRCFADADSKWLVQAPASRRNHGAVVGGLLTHTVRVTRIARFFAECCGAQVDGDVVTTAALLHDLGKLDELSAGTWSDASLAGELLGHVALGVLRVERIATDVITDPERRQAVLHAIAAAHGKPEWGAFVPPRTIEALIVHLADLTEAKLETALGALDQAHPDQTWTAFVPTLGSRFRVPISPVADVNENGDA